jgi:hypothetical protein
MIKKYKLTAEFNIAPKYEKNFIRLIKICLSQCNYETDKMKNGCCVYDWPIKNIKLKEVK